MTLRKVNPFVPGVGRLSRDGKDRDPGREFSVSRVPSYNPSTAAFHQYRQRINDAFRKFTSRESFACQNGVLRRTGVARLGRLTSAAGKQPSLSGSRPHHHHHHQPGRFSPLGDCLRSARCFFHNLSEFLVCMLVKPVSICIRIQ